MGTLIRKTLCFLVFSIAAFGGTPTYIITEGDSMTAGYGLSAGQDWPALMDIPGVTAVNMSRSGSRVDDCTPGTRISTPMTTDGTSDQVAVLWIGYNDIKVPRTAADIYTDITTWHTTIMTARPLAKTVIATVVDGGSFGTAGVMTAKRVILGELNTLIRANTAGFDAVVDINAHAVAADWEDTTYRDVDGTHFNLAGTEIISDLFQAAITGLYAANITVQTLNATTLNVTPP